MSAVFNHDPSVAHQDVTLVKEGDTLGMGVEDSVKDNDYPVIVTLKEGSPALDCGLELGDRVKSISNKWCKGKKKKFVHDAVRARPTGDAVLLQIIPVSEPWDREPDVDHFDIEVTKDRAGLGLGFSDATGANDYPRVDRIGEDSPAALTGQFNKGDKVKAINNYNVKGKKRTFLYDIVKAGGDTIYFQVIKDFEESGFVQDDTGAVRKTSVFRVNPLAAMMASMEDSEGSELEDEGTPAEAPKRGMSRRLSARFEAMAVADDAPELRRRGSITK